jgi:hypothetical protein
MPSVSMAIEFLKALEGKGRGGEKVHVVLVEEEQKARIENKGPKPRTKFVIETDSPEAYTELHKCKDFIIAKAGNKSVAISLMIWAWRKLDGPMIDHLLAAGEGPE